MLTLACPNVSLLIVLQTGGGCILQSDALKTQKFLNPEGTSSRNLHFSEDFELKMFDPKSSVCIQRVFMKILCTLASALIWTPPPPPPAAGEPSSVLHPQFLCDTFDADILPQVAQACAAACDFLHVGFGEPATLPV